MIEINLTPRITINSGYFSSNNRVPIPLIGDSIPRGNSTGAGPAPAAGTVFQWDTVSASPSVIEVGANDLIEPFTLGTGGSMWPQFGADIFNGLGWRPVFINTAKGGASFFRTTHTSFDWSAQDILWQVGMDRIIQCMTALRISSVPFVVVGLGINDVQDSYTLDAAHVQSIVDRINDWFNPTKIYLFKCSKANQTAGQTTRINAINGFIDAVATANVVKMSTIVDLVTEGGFMQVDDFHLNLDGNNEFGSRFATQVISDFS